jgi:hypothetical protein
MSDEQKLLFDEEPEPESWDSIRARRRHHGQKRRGTAEKQYAEAAAYARQNGFELVRHTDAHYKVKTAHFLLEVYPGNQRIYRHESNTPFIHLPDVWSLMDVVQGVAKVLKRMAPVLAEMPWERDERQWGESQAAEKSQVSPQNEFKQASMLASQYGFCLYKTGNKYSIRPTMSRSRGWEIVVDPATQTITRINDKGPHPELPNEWTLTDVVEAVHKRLEAHGYKPRPWEE